MAKEEEGVVVAGFVTEFIVMLKVLPPDITEVLIVNISEDELYRVQLEATEQLQVVVFERVTSIGTITKIYELEMSELVVVNVRVYAVTAFMEVLATETEGAVRLPVVNV